MFEWTWEREDASQSIIRMILDSTTLWPFWTDRETHLVTDASPVGISASLYQVEEGGCWVPIDHTSRALSETEQRWKSQIDWESLAKCWWMEQFRHYLVGTKFTSWGDHKPLLPYYNDLSV